MQKLSRSLPAKETLNAAEWKQTTVEVQLLDRQELEVILTDMGSGTSRGKRVAPARVSEAHAISRVKARNRSQQEQQSRDPDRSSSSSSSREDGDAIEGEADTAAADEQEQSWACVKRSPSSQKKKKKAVKKNKNKMSRSYGLCRSRQEDEESSAEEPRGSRDVNKRAFLHVRKQRAAPSGHMTVRIFMTL